ncbi:hypothetical protein TMatcc_002261 [Talaromyces marneffei ATCC 18224]|uniref:MFS multidrug transporter, putative n=1 Tax=Talaromyces marneffei (strain ATCC 18224 / CBS 334.59 / QM 7333) TaxID=441960 RepID=B6QJ57_TALMQ|nr:uncharacterized protein EYB26_006573 [Talaromyces marneffei]EEA23397.1 MFS multidrug transporter, putative [Talaromyces marneffei ATCC 18224]QGA18888.1 hypothetical protein EYB26_006573 [Talaromyces marneffei]
MDDKSTAQAGQLSDETLKDNASAGVSTATLNSPEQPSEILTNKEVFNDNSIQTEVNNEIAKVDAADSKGETASENSTGEWRFTRRAQLVFATLATLSLMVALDGTSISVALPIISNALHGTAIEAFWSGTSYLLTSTVLQPLFASLSNIFGRRPIMVISIVLFFVGCLVSGLANNFTTMLVGRSIQGVGGGGILALTEIIVTDIVPLRLRGQYLGILNGMWTIGSVAGPVLGGGFSESVSWRWIFYINFPFAGVGLVMTVLFLRLNFIPTSLLAKLRRIDYIGATIFMASTTSFMIPLSWGGVQYSWSSWRTLVPLILGFVGLLAFAYYEYRYAEHPIIPLEIFTSKTATVSFIGTVIQGLVLWCALYFCPLYFQAVKGYSPTMSGVAIFPDSFTVAPSAMVAGLIITKIGKYRWAVWVGWVLTTLGFGLLCVLQVGTSIPGWIFLEFSVGFGLGVIFPAVTFAIQASAKHETLAMAVAMTSFFRSFGQAIGVAIGGVVFQNRMYANLLQYTELAPYAREYSQDAAGLVQVINAMDDGPTKHDLRTAFTDSLRIIWVVCCVFSAVGFVFSLWTKEYDVNQALTSDQGLRDKHKPAPSSDV